MQPVAPATHLGFEVGADRKLANWQQITSYFHRIAEQSDRILVEEIGRSTEGRPMLLSIISAPANLARLDYYRAIQVRRMTRSPSRSSKTLSCYWYHPSIRMALI